MLLATVNWPQAKKNRPVPHTNAGAGTRGGLDSSYYYGAVPEGQKSIKLQPHQAVSARREAAPSQPPGLAA